MIWAFGVTNWISFEIAYTQEQTIKEKLQVFQEK